MKIKIFYGWYIVLAGFILTVYTGALFVYGWTVFVNPLLVAFGWGLTQISLASSLHGLESGVFNFIWGGLADRWSPKVLMIIGIVANATGIFLISRTTNLITYYSGFLVMGIGSSLCTGVVPNVVIARWFRKDLGKAISILSMGYGLGGIMVPLVRIYVDHFDWQNALLYSSIGLLVLGIPLAFIYRRRPADYGLEPDGKPLEKDTPSGRARNFDFGTSIRASLKMRAFWHIAGLSLVQYALTGAFMLYVVPYLTSPGIGMSRSNASMVAMVYSLVSLGYRIPLGILADRYPIKLMNAIAIGAMGTGLLAFAFIHAQGPLWLVIIFGLTYGFGVAGLMPLKTALLAEYFGTRNFGAVYGLNSIFVTAAVISSPVLTAMAFDKWGDSFSLVWIAGAVLALIAVVLMLTMPASVKHVAVEKDRIQPTA